MQLGRTSLAGRQGAEQDLAASEEPRAPKALLDAGVPVDVLGARLEAVAIRAE